MAIPPELTRAIRKLSKLLVAKIGLNAIDRIGEQAINTILESWYDEQGYEYSGEPVNWHHEGRKAENNITAIKTTGTTLGAIIGGFLTWLGLK